jgi:hypothetical protein
MLRKLIIIAISMILLISFQSAIGYSKSISIIENSQVKNLNFYPDIITMINKINQSILSLYLEKIVSFGIRYVGTENCRKASEYINEEFKNLGLYSYIDPWRFPKHKCQNVIATLNGTDPASDAIIVLTAHLDTTKNSVGANDDGSGVAAILTIANITSKTHLNHTIKFVIVSGEEKGLFGSFDYVKKTYKNNENIIANLNIDTIANSTFGNIIEIQTPDRSHWLYSYIDDVNQKYINFIDMKIQIGPHYPDDSQSFLDYGFDSLAFIQPNVFEYPVHTPEDTLDKINYPYFENVTKLILATTLELAEKEINVQVRFITPKEGYIYLFDIPVFRLPGFNVIKTGLRGMTYLIGKSIARINITTDEEIITVIYSIDGNTVIQGIFTEPPYDFKIKKPVIQLFRLRGKHRLGVHVCTSTGKTAYDEMDFFALTPI